tara:strand:- start:258 stop:557 length:300 start_codon:yes stop_codon:yes gene_type:complete
MFCRDCGKEIKENAAVCIHCGVAVSRASNPLDGDKEWLVTLLLCFFLGYLGVHRFYTGHIGIGIAQLLTLGGCGIWALIDFILILTGSFVDSEGQPLKK